MNSIIHFQVLSFKEGRGKELSDLVAYFLLNESYVLRVGLLILGSSKSYHLEVKSNL